jgi:hypothetical protein
VYPQADGTAWLSGRFWYSKTGISSKTYILRRVGGVWRVIGDPGT